MKTDRIYRTNQYKKTNLSRVCGIREKDGCDVISCASSVFFPEGGGQPSDTGRVTLNGQFYDIVHAYDEDPEGDVWHITNAPAGTFRQDDEVTLEIDMDGRMTNMQRHLGEHMLSGTFHSLFGGVNRGFHMGSDYITIDIDLDGRMLMSDELALAESKVNEAIRADLPVSISWFDDYESSLVMPVRKQVPHEGRISVVTVGDPSDPYDCIACCGTHPSHSSEVGLVAIYKCEPNKGMNRIFFDCGSKAREKLSADSRLLSDIAKRYSCSPSDLISRLDAEAESISDLRSRAAALSAYVRDVEKVRILSELSQNTSLSGTSYTYSTDILTVDELLKLGFSVISETKDLLLIMMHPQSSTCLLFSSGTLSCGKLIKEHAGDHGGRGGGRDDNARAVFKSARDMKSFAKALAEMVE